MTIPARLLTDRVTIRKPVQSFAAGTKRPVFELQVVASGVHARFDPGSSSINRNVLGRTPKRTWKLFLNPTELLENYEVVSEADAKAYVVTEVRDIFGRHLEAVVEERK